MTYDESQQRVVLFGGVNPSNALSNQVWSFNGTAWSQVSTGAGPSARMDASFVYDPARSRTFLYGGRNGPTPTATAYADTWEFAAGTWTVRSVAAPPARIHPAMAVDRARNRVVLFGGFNPANGSSFQDLWEWDGTAWTEVAASLGPAGTFAPSAAFDEARGITYVFLVRESDSVILTYSWNGTTFTQVNGAGPTLIPGAVASMGPGGGVLIFGGALGTNLVGTTWRWDGQNWTSIAGTGPAPRTGHRMAFDRARNRMVLYGGETSSGYSLETWEFDGTTWRRAL